MSDKKKISILARLRNYFLAGIVVLVPIGFTLYLTIFLIKISSKLLPNEINPNNYLPFSIPGLEILLSVIIIIIVGEPALTNALHQLLLYLVGALPSHNCADRALQK